MFLIQFLSECSGVFTENEIKELAEGEDPSVAQELSYSLLGSVKESEIPPDIPVKTVESTQLLLGEIPSPVGPLAQQTSVDIYETPECESSQKVTFAICQRSPLLSVGVTVAICQRSPLLSLPITCTYPYIPPYMYMYICPSLLHIHIPISLPITCTYPCIPPLSFLPLISFLFIVPLTTPPSTSLAFTLPSNKGSQEDLAKPRKGKGGGLFKHKGLKVSSII